MPHNEEEDGMGFSGLLPEKGEKAVKVKPLQARTMTLNELQMATLDLIRKVRFQFNKAPHEEGMTDKEFMDQVMAPLEATIYQDRHMIKAANRKSR